VARSERAAETQIPSSLKLSHDQALVVFFEFDGGLMTAITRLQSVYSTTAVQLGGPTNDRPVLYHMLGRLIQITLALYLLPVLFIVLVVGGIGMLALRIGQGLTDLVGIRSSEP
jgi:hypothetical protein